MKNDGEITLEQYKGFINATYVEFIGSYNENIKDAILDGMYIEFEEFPDSFYEEQIEDFVKLLERM